MFPCVDNSSLGDVREYGQALGVGRAGNVYARHASNTSPFAMLVLALVPVRGSAAPRSPHRPRRPPRPKRPSRGCTRPSRARTPCRPGAKIDHFGEHGRGPGRPAALCGPAGPVAHGRGEPLRGGPGHADQRRTAIRPGRSARQDLLHRTAAACNIARLTTVPVPGTSWSTASRRGAGAQARAYRRDHRLGSAGGWWSLAIPGTREAREEMHLAPRPDDWGKPWDQQRMRVLDVRVVQQGYVLTTPS